MSSMAASVASAMADLISCGRAGSACGPFARSIHGTLGTHRFACVLRGHRDRLVVVRAFLEAAEQVARPRLDDRRLVVVAREAAHRVERLESRDGDELDLVA